jgi:hypothetical protein
MPEDKRNPLKAHSGIILATRLNKNKLKISVLNRPGRVSEIAGEMISDEVCLTVL